MKHFCFTLKRNFPWLLLLLVVDLFAALLFWLSDVKAFEALIGMIVLFSVLLFAAVLLVTTFRERKKQTLFADFLSTLDAVSEEQLLRAVSQQEREQLEHLIIVLRNQQCRLNQMAEDLQDYEEYVEGWAHETKTPLSLLTMILDNRADEIPKQLQKKFDYVRSQLQEDVTQMLYYARLKSSTKDYRFQNVDLCEVMEEVLEDYKPLLEEKGFEICSSLKAETVFTDRRGLRFILGQIISNSIKYSVHDPVLAISMEHGQQEHILRISDNGIGVPSYDLPYIFQKGFTGDTTDSQKKATGMGLYLTQKMADDLGLKVNAKSAWGEGFEMTVLFPIVHRI